MPDNFGAKATHEVVLRVEVEEEQLLESFMVLQMSFGTGKGVHGALECGLIEIDRNAVCVMDRAYNVLYASLVASQKSFQASQIIVCDKFCLQPHEKGDAVGVKGFQPVGFFDKCIERFDQLIQRYTYLSMREDAASL